MLFIYTYCIVSFLIGPRMPYAVLLYCVFPVSYTLKLQMNYQQTSLEYILLPQLIEGLSQSGNILLVDHRTDNNKAGIKGHVLHSVALALNVTCPKHHKNEF